MSLRKTLESGSNKKSDFLSHLQSVLDHAIQMVDDELATQAMMEVSQQIQAQLAEPTIQLTDEKSEQIFSDPQLLSCVFEATREGVAIIDSKGTIHRANSALSRITGRTTGSLMGLSIGSLLVWEHPQFEDAYAEVQVGNPWNGVTRLAEASVDQRILHVQITKPPGDIKHPGYSFALISDITSPERTQQKLFTQAMFDAITALPNRQFFREKLSKLISNGSSESLAIKRLAICFIDLDEFKIVNDSMGHQAGDDLLKAVAQRLNQHLDSSSFVARFGGDEFAVLVPNLDPLNQKVLSPLDQFLDSLKNPFPIAESQAFVGASIGVTFFPDHGSDPDELLSYADMAMYSAKESGKGTLRIFDHSLKVRAQNDHRIQAMLRLALKEREISLVYQPKFSVETRECVGCEALARWTTSEGESISPGVFVPIAERTGLIVTLGEYVIAEACRQIQAWQNEGFTPPRVAVNISPQHLRHPAFIERIEAILAETEVRPDQLELEITENAVMEDVDYAVKIVDLLSTMNITIAIDDFGTGYSSLSYLKDFNVQTLKIDRSFVKDLPGDQSSVAIVRSVISLGKGRGLKIVAEGVETIEQYEMLAESGCDIIQGFLLSKPIPASQCREWFPAIAD